MKIVKNLPSRLHGGAIVQVLEALGISIPVAIKASAGSREDLSYAIRASKWGVDVATLDKALAQNSEFGIAERLRFKFACESCGIMSTHERDHHV